MYVRIYTCVHCTCVCVRMYVSLCTCSYSLLSSPTNVGDVYSLFGFVTFCSMYKHVHFVHTYARPTTKYHNLIEHRIDKNKFTLHFHYIHVCKMHSSTIVALSQTNRN